MTTATEKLNKVYQDMLVKSYPDIERDKHNREVEQRRQQKKAAAKAKREGVRK